MSQALQIQDQIAPVSYTLFQSDFDAFTKALGDSYARWGFAVISDHGGTPGRWPQVSMSSSPGT